MKKNTHSMESLLRQAIADAVGAAYPGTSLKIEEIPLGHPKEITHGDYATTVALRLATLAQGKQKDPIEIAEKIAKALRDQFTAVEADEIDHTTGERDQKISNIKYQKSKIPVKNKKEILSDSIGKVEVAGPGFINLWLKENFLITQMQKVLSDGSAYGNSVNPNPQTIMVEFAHPNTHKAFHIGHLRNITTGESIVRLLQSQGHRVIRANYQGDVGMHIAKALFGLLQTQNSKLKAQNCGELLKGKSLDEKIAFLGDCYVAGSKAYDEDEKAKIEIGNINKQIYAKDPVIFPLYQETRQWSLDYFENIYQRVGTHYDRYYFESETFERGKELVLKGVEKGIFEKSDNAIIFPGGKYGLHNRVFITSEGNATYEGKDIGLGELQFNEYHPDLIVHVVGPEQAEYFKVVFEALMQMFPDTKGKEFHLIYGWVKLKEGKMSSRSGNVVLGEWLLDRAQEKIKEILETSKKGSDVDVQMISESAAVAAVKYSFLKVGTVSEIAFDLETSVSFDGDSGPYVQYTYARTQSVLRKVEKIPQLVRSSHLAKSVRDDTAALKSLAAVSNSSSFLNPEELLVLRILSRFPQVVTNASESYSPSIVCGYLYELAQSFNGFYQKHKIQDSSFRLFLTSAVGNVLRSGLYLLGIEAPEKM